MKCDVAECRNVKKSNHINVKDTNCDDGKCKVYFICTEMFIYNVP